MMQSIVRHRVGGIRCTHPERIVGPWETRVCRYLASKRVPHDHHPIAFPVRLKDGRNITYTPDMMVGNLILEPHGRTLLDKLFIDKMTAFRHEYPDFRVILLTSDCGFSSVPPDIFWALVSIYEVDKLSGLLSDGIERAHARLDHSPQNASYRHSGQA
jgi:hypothetical protein